MSLEEQLLNAFTELDSTEVTTGILYERVPVYLPLKHFDGTEYGDSIAMDRQSFLLAYGMIYHSHYNNAELMPFEEYFKAIE